MKNYIDKSCLLSVTILFYMNTNNKDYQIIKNKEFKKVILIKWQNFIHIIHCVLLLMNKIC